MPLSLALETRALKEKERVDEDPALSARPVPSALPKPTGLVSAPSHTVSSATTPDDNNANRDRFTRTGAAIDNSQSYKGQGEYIKRTRQQRAVKRQKQGTVEWERTPACFRARAKTAFATQFPSV
jgi:hypothetical protein